MSETKVNLGFLPVNRGTYSNSATYYKDNIVQYNGSSYICTQDPGSGATPQGITGEVPYVSQPDVPNTHWAVFVNNQGGPVEGIYDVSANHATDNTPKAYDSLSAALADVPTAKKTGGLVIKFIQTTPATYNVVKTEGVTELPTGTLLDSASSIASGTYTASQLTDFSTLPTASAVTYYVAVTEDETTTYTTWVITLASAEIQEYVQYRLMKTAWSNVVTDWQGVDSEPTAGSRNLVESGGVIGDVMPVLNRTFNVVAKESGKYVKRDGTIGTASSSISVSDYIKIEGGNNFKVLSGVKMPGSTSYCAICFFSDFNTPCGYYATTANTELINVEITVPDDAKYAKFNIVDINTVGIIEYKGSVIKNVSKLVDNVESLQQTTETQQRNINTIKDFIEAKKQYYSKELSVPSKDDGLLQESTGNVVYNVYIKNYGVSDYIDISGYEKVKIISGAYQGGNSSYAYAAAYDENKTFISPAYVNTQKSTEITNQEIVLPRNAAFLRVTLIDKTSTTKIEEPGKIDIIDEKLQDVDEQLQNISQNIIPFKNKGKLVYLFGGSHTVFAQSEVAKDMWRNNLGMTVKSCGCGSTAIVAGLTLRGWVNDGTYYYTRNNYPQVWDDYGFLIEGVTAPTSQDVDSITLSNGLVCTRASEKDYFQNNQIKLLRLIEKNVPTADIYIFQCSSNDYATNYSLGTYTDYTAVDNYDTTKIYIDNEHRGTVLGGFNRCIKTIREENPAAEIYVFTDYRIFDRGRTGYDPYTNEYPNGMNKNYYEFQQEICKAAKVAGCAVLDQFMLQGVDEHNYTGFYLVDNLHLNEDGYRKIGYLQVDFLSNGK